LQTFIERVIKASGVPVPADQRRSRYWEYRAGPASLVWAIDGNWLVKRSPDVDAGEILPRLFGIKLPDPA